MEKSAYFQCENNCFYYSFRHEKTVEDMKQELTQVSNVSVICYRLCCVCIILSVPSCEGA